MKMPTNVQRVANGPEVFFLGSLGCFEIFAKKIVAVKFPQGFRLHTARDALNRNLASRSTTSTQRFGAPLIIALGVFLVFLGGVHPTALRSQSIFCVPPAVPSLPSDPTMRAEFRPELSAEFAQYFTDAQSYLNCLHDAHGVTRLEIEAAIQDYTTLLDTPPKQD